MIMLNIKQKQKSYYFLFFIIILLSSTWHNTQAYASTKSLDSKSCEFSLDEAFFMTRYLYSMILKVEAELAMNNSGANTRIINNGFLYKKESNAYADHVIEQATNGIKELCAKIRVQYDSDTYIKLHRDDFKRERAIYIGYYEKAYKVLVQKNSKNYMLRGNDFDKAHVFLLEKPEKFSPIYSFFDDKLPDPKLFDREYFMKAKKIEDSYFIENLVRQRRIAQNIKTEL